MQHSKNRKLEIQPVFKNDLPMCHDECESRCLKAESQIGPSGCYAWDKRIMGKCQENPDVCIPWRIQKRIESK
jgi:hypothetical protein